MRFEAQLIGSDADPLPILGEKEDFPASYDPETILEFLRQWSTTAESIVPLSLGDCLTLAYGLRFLFIY